MAWTHFERYGTNRAAACLMLLTSYNRDLKRAKSVAD